MNLQRAVSGHSMGKRKGCAGVRESTYEVLLGSLLQLLLGL